MATETPTRVADPAPGAPTSTPPSTGPPRPGLVLAALILVATVANLNLAVANVALPDIGKALDASQTGLNLVAIGYSLGLASSVLWFAAVGDRHGRKRMLVLGTALSVPACVLAAWAPNVAVLVAARVGGGLAAGMAFPTTLALITALWSGPARTRAIALWSAIGGGAIALGSVLAGIVLEFAWWGSVFLITLPLAVVAVVMSARLVPAHVNETTDPVDHLGGVLSVVLVASLVAAINFGAVPGASTVALVLLGVSVVALLAFVIRQRRCRFPLYDLHVAARRIFWVAAAAGIVVFGALMGAMFIGQQFLQDVLGYDTLAAGVSLLPAAVCMVLVAPHSAHLVEARGARFTLLMGYTFCLLGFVAMLVLWRDGVGYWAVGLAFSLIGVGVGLAGTPASHSLTGSVPVTRAGMASGTADLQRDLGGAVLQSVLGALLTAGYAGAIARAVAGEPAGVRAQVTGPVEASLQKSYSGAVVVAERYPQYRTQIIAAARESFTSGQRLAYVAGIVSIVLGGVLVATCFPARDDERRLLAGYHRIDSAAVRTDAVDTDAVDTEGSDTEGSVS